MITVVNVIPSSLSGETAQDSEPNLTINPADPNQIAISAFTPDPLGGSNAPIFISTNGGVGWTLNSIVPSQAGSGTGTGDITPRFAGRSNNFYAGILRVPGFLRLNVLRTNNFASPTAMAILEDRNDVDQPYTKAVTVLGGEDAGRERLYIGMNDFNAPNGRTATIEHSLDAGVAAPTLTPVRIERRNTGSAGQDGPQIRPVTHPDGTVYAVFYGWRSFVGSTVTADVTVVRDDNWGLGANPYSALVDPGDGLAGIRVVTSVTFTWNGSMGQERLGGDLSIAVDPNNSSIVYIAYCDVQSGSYTLHIRRSLNRGVTWSPDLKMISNTKNPALAINSKGAVGLAYQRVTGSGSSQKWETHFELTTNGFASSTDSVLASVPANTPVPTFLPYIGDYMDMTAMGKDFYGVFSANNTPNLTNFPNGVTFLRNHNFTTNQLLANDNTTTVAVSIDPFFFKVTDIPPSNDLYVRDWTDSPASHDTGLEPSSNPWFYVNSDVWNRRSNAPGGFNANDQPVNQTPQMAMLGSNFAFCRVSRNASGTAENPTAHFLYSEFGTGSNYQDANTTPDPSISLPASDLSQTMAAGYEWLLPATSSTHLCLAVEITSANDPLKLPGLIGRAPGWPTTDLIVINDNNKGQRNMGVYPATNSATGTLSFYAIAHNAAVFQRSMVLVVEVEERALPAFSKAVVEVVDSHGERHSIPFKPNSEVVLPEMRPGDNAWVGVTLPAPSGKMNDLFPLTFRELVDGKPVNGFAIAPQLSRPILVFRANVELQSASFLRAAMLFGLKANRRAGALVLKYTSRKVFSGRNYAAFLNKSLDLTGKAIGELLGMNLAPDSLDLSDALAALKKAAKAGDLFAALNAHTTLAHKLDAYVTMLQKTQGDVADILQTVSWQSALFAALKEQKGLSTADKVIEVSDAFVADYQIRKATNADYPKLVSSLMDAYKATAEELSVNADIEIVAMQDALKKSLSGLQKAHREYLLLLFGLVS